LGFLDNFLGWMVMTLAVMPVFIVLLLARSAPKRRSPGAYAPDERRPAAESRETSELQAHEQMLERKARKGRACHVFPPRRRLPKSGAI